MKNTTLPTFLIRKNDGSVVSILNEPTTDSQHKLLYSNTQNPLNYNLSIHSSKVFSKGVRGVSAAAKPENLLDSDNNDNLINSNDPFSKVKKKPLKKYHCDFSNCNKYFTTAGHLARHKRIHTGEKNFKCIYPGCNSKFSRQDNMLQHYRTHTSSKSQKKLYPFKRLTFLELQKNTE
ncbi:hypothetical protein BB561_004287 [Smittium simulii]|uniref:C2H2-type domain-containing protein n=1 Tax=Smittium simulii TaxID=133385 RepID=A0A2T9YH21_9FUNG|nr:hypothetical protein BB561_004287 [Smittium simulii]